MAIIRSETDPGEDDLAVIRTGMRQFTIDQLGVFTDYQDVNIMARDEQGQLLGAGLGEAGRGWLNIQVIWVAKDHRQQGIGSEILSQMEDAGRAEDCQYAFLDTFSYQARPFYERHGFVVFGQLDDYPPGHSRYYMKKEL